VKIRITSLNVRTKTFQAELDAGPGFIAALLALNLSPDFEYVLDIEGQFRIYGVDDGASVELDSVAYLIHPKTGAAVSFGSANLDTQVLEEALFEAGYNNADVQQEYSEMLQAAGEAAWESYNDL
jgi:hypothetical protein